MYGLGLQQNNSLDSLDIEIAQNYQLPTNFDGSSEHDDEKGPTPISLTDLDILKLGTAGKMSSGVDFDLSKSQSNVNSMHYSPSPTAVYHNLRNLSAEASKVN